MKDGYVESANLGIRVQPMASRNEIVVKADGNVRVYVTFPSNHGKANEAVMDLLAGRLWVAKSRIRILRGHRASSKVLFIEGLDDRQVMDALSPTVRF